MLVSLSTIFGNLDELTMSANLLASPEGHVPKGSGDIEGVDSFSYVHTNSSRSADFAAYNAGNFFYLIIIH